MTTPSQRWIWALSGALFVLSAWPLATVTVLPFQDLPNHLASIHVLWHPDKYPGLVANGFFKTNAALFAWLYWVGKPLGLHLAAKLFTLGVLALNAITYPRFVHELTGSRGKTVVASLFMWPMVHDWWVSMGMLDYALGIPISLWLLLLAGRQMRAPSWKTALWIGVLSIACWYAHCFALLVAGLLIAVEATHLERHREHFWRSVRWIGLPLLPVAGLTVMSIVLHLTEPEGPMTGDVQLRRMLPTWELIYHLWAEWCCGFTWRTLTSFAVVIGGAWGLLRVREPAPFFSVRAMILLGAVYMLMPYSLTNWFHVSSRFVPYIWFGFLLRVPEQLPRWLSRGLGVCALLYSIGLGVEYRLLDRDRAEFMAAVDAVPEGSDLLPLLFTRKQHSEHTQNLLHAWGYYVMAKDTSAPLLFAHSRAFPVMYRTPPAPRFNHLVLEAFPVHMRTRHAFCDRTRENSQQLRDHCEAEYAEAFLEFWDDARARFDHVLMWDPTDVVLANMPPYYVPVFHQGKLWLYARQSPPQ